MTLSPQWLDELRARTTLSAVISPSVKLLRAGREWKAGSVAGEPGQSLSVCIAGAKAGVWKDFQSGDSGDLLDLWVAARGITVSEAISEAAAYLGVREVRPPREDRTFKRPAKPKCHTPKSRVREWLESRGLEARTIEAFKVGEQERDGKVNVLMADSSKPMMVLPNARTRNVRESLSRGTSQCSTSSASRCTDENAARFASSAGPGSARTMLKTKSRAVAASC